MRTLLRALSIIIAVSALTACGGGGTGSGGGGGANEPPEGLKVSINPNQTQLPANPGEVPPRRSSDFTTEVTVEVSRADGSAVPDGTIVNMTVNPVSSGAISKLDDPETEENEFTQLFGRLDAETTAGQATYFFTSGPEPGDVTLRASVDDPDTSRTSTGTQTIEVTEGPPASERIQFQATRTRLPANVANVQPFIGSPYISEIQVSINRADGTPVPNGEQVNFNVFPVELGALSTLDDPETQDVNEFVQLVGAGFEEVNSGQIKLFFHSFDKPGTATVTVSYDDPETGETIFNTLDIEIVEAGSTLLPESLTFNGQNQPLYVQGSGGDTSIQFEIIVEDGAGEPVPDPQERGNVQVELVDQGPSLGAKLTGTSFAGNPVSGGTIRLATTNGRTTASLVSGSKTGTQTVKVTADREDNNVQNGIGDPVSNLFDVAISDGQLFSLTLTSPDTGAIAVNGVESTTVVDGDTSPNGSYSLTVSALATDQGGNPVVPGQQIQFGLVDFPLNGFPSGGPGTFAISGADGDPDEGGERFVAPTGQFRNAGGGVHVGDTLVLFAEEAPPGNARLEGSRKVNEILSNTVLRVTQSFDLNEGSGSSTDNGPEIPYAIGRAKHGNIDNSARTNDKGVASVQLNYPVSQLGRSVALWAQGAGGLDSRDEATTVGEAVRTSYPGLAPVVLIASPDRLPGNTTSDVLVCVEDALGSPLLGKEIGFTVANNQGATISVDGSEGSGTVSPATGADGCATATVTSSGVAEGMETIELEFFLGEASDIVEILPPDSTVLQAIPSGFTGNGIKEVLLRLLDAGGNPIPDVQIVAECESGEDASATVIEGPGTTDENGETTAKISADVDTVGGGASTTCTFRTASGPPPEVEVFFRGRDLCEGASPQPPECEEA
jgi:hypothetical protein